MQSKLFCFITLILVSSNRLEAAICSVKPNTAIITGLFPIHSGDDCSIVELRGIQQAASLQATVNNLNQEIKKESNILINVKIEDTCSSESGAVKAALKSMVDTDQTCLHPPLFMGFVGPEDKNIIEAVHQVTKLFDATHVVPYNIEGSSLDEAIIPVTDKHTQNEAKSILEILRKLSWKVFSLAVDDSLSSQFLAKHVLEALQGDRTLCVVNNVYRITDTASTTEALIGSSGRGLLLLSDKHESIMEVLKVNKLLSLPMVLYINDIGLEDWQIPVFNSSLVILQRTISETINGVSESIDSSMYNMYLKQQEQLKGTQCKDGNNGCNQNIGQDEFQGILDSSVLPISHAVRLMASTLLVAHKAKCSSGSEISNGLCPKLSQVPQSEWRNLLKRSNALYKQNGILPVRIRFQMEIRNAMEIFIRNKITLSIDKIGQINGNQIQFLPSYSFQSMPIKNDNKNNEICPNNYNNINKIQMPVLPTLLTLVTPKPTQIVLSEPVEATTEDGSFYDMITFLCAASLGIFVFFMIMIYLVYTNFKVKEEKHSTAGTPPMQRKPSRIARWRRGSGQSSRASIRSIE